LNIHRFILFQILLLHYKFNLIFTTGLHIFLLQSLLQYKLCVFLCIRVTHIIIIIIINIDSFVHISRFKLLFHEHFMRTGNLIQKQISDYAY
jgi:hypothetical protein